MWNIKMYLGFMQSHAARWKKKLQYKIEDSDYHNI